jgi:hypothetical protein
MISSLALADLNGDSRPDVAVANNTASTIGVLLGDGTGGFQPVMSYATTGGAGSIAAADLNSDNRIDLIVLAAVGTGSGLNVFLNACPM